LTIRHYFATVARSNIQTKPLLYAEYENQPNAQRNSARSAFTIAALIQPSSVGEKIRGLLAAGKKEMRRLSARRHFGF